MIKKITVIGGGLAGCEAAWTVANLGVDVDLYEMRPQKNTPAHKTSYLGELVCSNSLKSKDPETPAGLLKSEMQDLGSLILEAATYAHIPAGQALGVDRHLFSSYITEKIENHPRIQVIREEITSLPKESVCIIATGPLTSDALTQEIQQYTGYNRLYFFDAISPIVNAESIDMEKCFRASRYDKGGDDYLNCPLTEEEYHHFVSELLKAEKVEIKAFEQNYYFESCLPIEVLAERGPMTLAFGPMKPVGLMDPKTGKRPFAVVQLRMENQYGTLYNLVGFQTKLKYPEQKRIFSLIPALHNAHFERLGSIHRNTYINSPDLLTRKLQLKKNPFFFFAGQITGVEGYVESASMGIVAGLYAHAFVADKKRGEPPHTTALGALLQYITTPNPHFQPMNINFGLLPPGEHRDKKIRKQKIIEKARSDFKEWFNIVIPAKAGI
ncbi:MAG: methylenetetrahydrofolate--tRNA-(uracil(54)-C(5))-methyltransferase (FADH(2)-oxidizing) TrmFO [Deltaproteobacteria bacterium]|nr:methylenetetrahydrofolate--tRNA-(uracil(54)-C(5))-methyltransferase (FADH(2)-oxidizing) TrmFO [Deltaproteobacteria bacterium]